MITQQPGSISHEILSQGDNWFIFHLLSAGDLFSVKKANAHFSDDLLSTLLNEPIPGHGVFWSSAGGKSYPVPVRVLSFEQAYSARDPKYSLPAAKTFAQTLKERFHAAISASRAVPPSAPPPDMAVVAASSDASRATEISEDTTEAVVSEAPEDVLKTYSKAAIATVAQDKLLLDRIRGNGVPWRGVIESLEKALPDVLDDRNKIANDLVRQFMDELFGKGKWQTERRQSKSSTGMTTWLISKK